MVILFDGICNLCNRLVHFVIKRDKNNIFKFASLQSNYGTALLTHFHIPLNSFETIILYDGKDIYFKSNAIIKILSSLGRQWKVVLIFKIIPEIIRNFFYDLIAKRRYKLFGKRDSCIIPNPEEKAKFMDDILFKP